MGIDEEEEIEKVRDFRYLRLIVTASCEMEELCHGLSQEARMTGGLGCLWRGIRFSDVGLGR